MKTKPSGSSRSHLGALAICFLGIAWMWGLSGCASSIPVKEEDRIHYSKLFIEVRVVIDPQGSLKGRLPLLASKITQQIRQQDGDVVFAPTKATADAVLTVVVIQAESHRKNLTAISDPPVEVLSAKCRLATYPDDLPWLERTVTIERDGSDYRPREITDDFASAIAEAVVELNRLPAAK